MVEGSVLICGVFDLLHQGHLQLIRRAAELGPVRVGLLSDRLAGEYKRPPVMNYWERKATLLELPWIAEVVEKKSHDMRDLIRQYQPKFVVCGSDWAQEPFYSLNCLSADFMERNEVTMVFLPSNRHMTTSKIIDRIRDDA